MKLRYKLLIGLPLLAVVSVGALLWGIQYTGGKALEAAMAGVAADGGPMDYLRFAQPELPDADNAAVAWLRAVEPLDGIDAAAPWVSPEASEAADPYGGGGGGGDIQPEVDAIADPAVADAAVLGAAIGKRQSVIDALWAAADLEAVCWSLPYDDPGALVSDLTFFPEVWKGSRVLVADAWHAWRMGDAVRADKSLAAGLAAADDVMELPLVLGVLVAGSVDSMVMTAVREMEIGGAAGFPHTRAMLAERDYRRWLSRAYLHEPIGVIAQDFESELWADHLWTDDNPLPAGLRGIAGRLWRNHDLAFNMETLREMAGLAARPYPEALAELKVLEARSIPAVFPISRLDLMSSPHFFVARADTQRVLALWASEPDREPPQDPLVGGALRQWAAPDGGRVLWSSAAEDPAGGDYLSYRPELVWRVGTRELPPELVPFADEIHDVEE